MSDLRNAAEDALAALEGVLDTYGEPLDRLSISGGAYEALQCRDAITVLRAALADHEQKPWRCACGANLYIDENGAPRSKA